MTHFTCFFKGTFLEWSLFRDSRKYESEAHIQNESLSSEAPCPLKLDAMFEGDFHFFHEFALTIADVRSEYINRSSSVSEG